MKYYGAQLERDITSSICDFLELKKIFFWRSNNIPATARDRQGKMVFRRLPKYTPRGIPDIICIKNGRFIGLEVKRENMKLRPEQAEFGIKCDLNGAIYRVVRSIDDVIAIKELWMN